MGGSIPGKGGSLGGRRPARAGAERPREGLEKRKKGHDLPLAAAGRKIPVAACPPIAQGSHRDEILDGETSRPDRLGAVFSGNAPQAVAAMTTLRW